MKNNGGGLLQVVASKEDTGKAEIVPNIFKMQLITMHELGTVQVVGSIVI
jgi:hypothetical protein